MWSSSTGARWPSLAICNDQLVRRPPPTLHLCAGPPASSRSSPQLPPGPVGTLPSGPHRGVLPQLLHFLQIGVAFSQSNVSSYVVDLVAGHQDRPGWPRTPCRTFRPLAQQPPHPAPPSPNLQGAQHHLQQASRVGCSGALEGTWGCRGGPLASAPSPTSLCSPAPQGEAELQRKRRRSPAAGPAGMSGSLEAEIRRRGLQ